MFTFSNSVKLLKQTELPSTLEDNVQNMSDTVTSRPNSAILQDISVNSVAASEEVVEMSPQESRPRKRHSSRHSMQRGSGSTRSHRHFHSVILSEPLPPQRPLNTSLSPSSTSSIDTVLTVILITLLVIIVVGIIPAMYFQKK